MKHCTAGFQVPAGPRDHGAPFSLLTGHSERSSRRGKKKQVQVPSFPELRKMTAFVSKACTRRALPCCLIHPNAPSGEALRGCCSGGKAQDPAPGGPAPDPTEAELRSPHQGAQITPGITAFRRSTLLPSLWGPAWASSSAQGPAVTPCWVMFFLAQWALSGQVVLAPGSSGIETQKRCGWCISWMTPLRVVFPVSSFHQNVPWSDSCQHGGGTISLGHCQPWLS